MINKVILKYDCDLYDDLSLYLLNLKGINNVIVNKNDNIIEILYDFNVISLYIISKEIELFLQIDKFPSLIGFDKCSNSKLEYYDIIIKDLCCEYCLKSNIWELLVIDGVSKVYTDFDYKCKDNVRINVLYDSNLISIREIINIEKKFNSE